MKNSIFLSFSSLFLIVLVFSSCRNNASQEETGLSDEQRQAYLEKGREIAGATFVALSGQLQAAMKEGGVSNAAQYCNLAAYPLVDSLSKVHEALIRRTSMKVRNPKDAPDDQEKAILEAYAQKEAAGEELKPVIQEIDPHTIGFYAPIRVNEFCLQCHGKVGETLSEENHAAIKELYPEDEAIGYSAGDLRGMWSIQFKK
jgi:hypothetical protein